jgi:hypothetical protein
MSNHKPLYPQDGIAYTQAMVEAMEEYLRKTKKLTKAERSIQVYARKMKED